MIRSLSVLAFLMSAPAVADMVDIKWDPNGHFAFGQDIGPGEVVESCTGLNAGTQIDWHYAASAPLDFNIHYHIKDGAVYPAKLDHAQRGESRLEVRIDHGYCWMWENKGTAPARLDVKLDRVKPGA